MIVTTLPITPGKCDFFVTLFGPLIADIFSKMTDAPFKMVLNVGHSFRSFDGQINKYVNQLRRMNILPFIGYDTSIEYRNHIQYIINDLFGRKILKIKKINMVHCSCGAVELPYLACEIIGAQERHKYISNGYCTRCGERIMTDNEEVLELSFPKLTTKISVNLPMYNGPLKQSISAMEARPIIVSRNHRQGFEVFIENKTFTLDADFCWSAFLSYLGGMEFCIVASSNTINHSVRAIQLLNVYEPVAKVCLIFYPLLVPVDSEKTILSGFSIDDYLEFCGASQFARTFLMLGAKWRQSDIVIKAQDLYLVEKSVYPKQSFVSTGGDTVVVAQNFCEIVNCNKILELLKIMRGHRVELSGIQMKLKEILFS